MHVSECGLICPDVDRGLVNHYAGRYFSINGKTMIRLYMSQKDKALALSQIVHGGYTRLGECADSLAAIARDAMKSRIETPTETTEAEVHDMFEKSKHRMQTIDFTVVDSGLIGHHIPTELIYNISYTNSPGTGLLLVPQESGQRSRASRLLSRLTRLQVDAMVPSDTCFRVVKAGSVKTAAAQAPAR